MRILLLGLAFLAGPAFAHGVGYRDAGMKSIALEFFYSTGEKMSYREARVFSPKDPKFAAQTGRTDEQGRFAFIPDVSGDWIVIVRDEEGHQCTAVIPVTLDDSEAAPTPEASTLPQGMDLVIRALLGVSIIMNIAMIVRAKYAHQ